MLQVAKFYMQFWLHVYANYTDYSFVVGKLCQSEETSASVNIRERCGPLETYIRSLETDCPVRIPGVVEWRPDENTPDIVYYQVRGQHSLIDVVKGIHL